MATPEEERDKPAPVRWRGIRLAYQALGFLALGLGFLGVFLPLLPTTIFVLIAAWAFARSSDRLHDWLYTHPRFGPLLVDWDRHGVVRPRAKALSTAMIGLSFAITVWLGVPFWLIWVLALTLSAVVVYILTRPSFPP